MILQGLRISDQYRELPHHKSRPNGFVASFKNLVETDLPAKLAFGKKTQVPGLLPFWPNNQNPSNPIVKTLAGYLPSNARESLASSALSRIKGFFLLSPLSASSQFFPGEVYPASWN
jgi:purine nucleoside permease